MGPPVLLEQPSLPHALGSALALGVAGVLRGTKAVDVNVFVDDAEVPRVIAALEALGIELDVEMCRSRARVDGMFVGSWDGMRIDVFVPSGPHRRALRRRAVNPPVISESV